MVLKMMPFSHIAYPYIIINLLTYITPLKVTPAQNLLLAVFSILPDSDYLIRYLVAKIRREKIRLNEVQHHKWPSHWPISYLPLLVIFLMTPSVTTFLMVFGVYSHLVLDLIATGDGIMLFYPFKKNFYMILSKHTKGKMGWEWVKTYKKLRVYKLEKVVITIVAIHFAAILLF